MEMVIEVLYAKMNSTEETESDKEKKKGRNIKTDRDKSK